MTVKGLNPSVSPESAPLIVWHEIHDRTLELEGLIELPHPSFLTPAEAFSQLRFIAE